MIRLTSGPAACAGERLLRIPWTAARLGTLVLLSMACTGENPPASLLMRQTVPIGPFTLSVSRKEIFYLPETSSRTSQGLGLAVFLKLSLADPHAIAEIAALVDEERRIGQTIADMRSTQRNFDDSELTDSLADLIEKEEELARIRPRSNLFTRAIRVVDEEGKEYRLSGFVMEQTYATQMRFRERSTGELFDWLASLQEHAGYTQGESGQEWVLLFRLPRRAGDLSLRIRDPEPREGRPRQYAVSLGRP